MSFDRIQDFWQSLLPREIADQPCLYTWRKNRFQASSYKDLNAQANCAAAYLMDKGLQKGGVLAVISEASFSLLALDLGLQYLGATGLYLDPDLPQEELFQAIRAHGAQFVFVGEQDKYIALGELAELKPELKGVFLETEDADGLSSDKLVTFDIMVLRGKIAWREQAPRLADCKAAVGPDDTYALFAHNPKNPLAFAPVRYARVLEHLKQATESLEALPKGGVLSLAKPNRYLYHVHGSFAALANQRLLYLAHAEQLATDQFLEAKPAMLVALPSDIQVLYDHLPDRFLGKPDPKPIEKAQELIDVFEEAQAAGKKPPFMKKMKYNAHNKGLYKQVRKRMGGQLGLLVSDHDEPERRTSRFFREAGLSLEATSLF